MSRKRDKSTKVGASASGTLDSSHDGSSPMSPESKGGGSVMAGSLLTEGSYIAPPKLTFIESPQGQRYIARKSTPMSLDDVGMRLRAKIFDIRGYFDVGSITRVDLDGYKGGEQLLLDWYPLVRDMGKRSLKYKHLPLTMTDYTLVIGWLNTYFYVLANMTTLMNMNRLAMFSIPFSQVDQYFAQYMARITRLWRRTSVLSAPPFLKAFAIRSGMIPWIPMKMAPVVTLWRHDVLPASVKSLLTTTQGDLWTQLAGVAGSPVTPNLSQLVASLEQAERWLEVGTIALSTDFTAMRDLVDMTADVVPGTWAQGLPDSASLPGLSQDATLLNDVLARACLSKDQVVAGVDQWGLFPNPEYGILLGRAPIQGFGAPDPLLDFTQLGSVKFGFWNVTPTTFAHDVNTACRLVGTCIDCVANLSTGISQAAADAFGHTIADTTLIDEVIIRQGDYATATGYQDGINCNDAAAIRQHELDDTIKDNHLWHRSQYALRGTPTAHTITRFVDETDPDFLFWADPEDYGLNYAQFIADRKSVV